MRKDRIKKLVVAWLLWIAEHTLWMSLQTCVVKDLINRSAASQTDRRLGVSMTRAHNENIAIFGFKHIEPNEPRIAAKREHCCSRREI